MSVHRLECMFPSEIAARLAAQPLLVLPMGTLEWHSHHLPVGLDGLVAVGIAEALAERTGALLAPLSWWAAGGVPFPYTLNLPAPLIEPLLTESLAQFGAMGLRVIVALTGHFGRDHTAALKRAAWEVMQRSPVTILPLTPYDLITDMWEGDHAAAGETSLLLALEPSLVRLDAVAADAPLPGVIGAEPRGNASVAWGRAALAAITARGAAQCTRLLAAGADERTAYIAAVEGAVHVLEAINRLRAAPPPEGVPPLVTPAYKRYCTALAAGDYVAAQQHIQAKLGDLTR